MSSKKNSRNLRGEFLSLLQENQDIKNVEKQTKHRVFKIKKITMRIQINLWVKLMIDKRQFKKFNSLWVKLISQLLNYFQNN